MGRTLAIDERGVPAPTHYAWSFPGSPIKVQLNLAVVDRLQKQLQQSDCVEQEHGLLLGRSSGHTSEINDFRALSPSALSDIQSIAASAQESGEPSVIGYYRVQQNGVLRMSERDFSLAEAIFPGAHQVFLLIQFSDSGPANATFFFRDEGRMCGDFPFLEFPFDVPLLTAAEQHKIDAAQQKAKLITVATETPPEARRSPRRRSALRIFVWALLVALALAVSVTGFIALKVFPGRPISVSHTTPASPPPPSSLGLQAEKQQGDLKLTWDRQAAPILAATSGTLTILDGDSKREILLDATLVHGGSLLYSPTGDQIQMQLTINGPEQRTETVIVILPKVGPPQVQPVNLKSASTNPVERTPTEGHPFSAPLKPFTAPKTEVKQPVVSDIGNEEPPNVVRPTAATALPIALLKGPPPASQAPAPLASPTTVPSLAPSRDAGSRPSPATTTEPLRFPQQYHPPEATSKVLPSLPNMMLRLPIYKTTVVEVTVSINPNGKVTKVTPIPRKGELGMLVQASVSAARLWKFRPAQLGGQAVASEMVLSFSFAPDK